VKDIAERATSYAMPSAVVDGQDLDAVASAMGVAVDRARSGGGPTLLEMKTYRYSGHSRSDPATYRPEGELDEWLARDPIDIYASRLQRQGVLDVDAVAALRADIEAEVDRAVETAKQGPEPDRSEMFAHVYAS
jgi:pyruvate dehydrogenase E1 component alpha subunit